MAYHHGDLRNALLAAARELLETQDIETLSLREVARATGVSANAPYRHFPDKAALLAALATQGFQELDAALYRAVGATTDKQFVTGCAAYVEFALSHRALLRLMFGGCTLPFSEHPELAAAAESSFRALLGFVAQQTGGELESEATFQRAIAVWSLVHGYARLKMDGALEFHGDHPLPTIETLAGMLRL